MKAIDLQTPSKLGAGCLILCSETERFLLVQRSELIPMPLVWSLPGGKVDNGETPLDAARREVMEEIGFNLTNCPIKLIYTNDVHAPRFRFYTYAAIVTEEFTPSLNWESAAYSWCTLDEIPDPLHWGVSQLINHDGAAKILKQFINEQQKI